MIGLENVLKRHNLEIFHVQNLTIHGGSNRYFIKKIFNKRKIEKSVLINKNREIKYGLEKLSTYKQFAKRVISSKITLKKF